MVSMKEIVAPRGEQPATSPTATSSPAAEIITVSPPRIAAVQLAAMQPVIGARRL